MFTPLKKTTIAYDIITHFSYLIRSGKIKIGDRLPSERSMAEALDVSRSSVREAMKILAFNKIVEIRQGNGTFLRATPLQLTEQLLDRPSAGEPFVSDPSAFVQTLEIRMLLEPPMGRLVAVSITDEELAELDGIIERMEKLVENPALGSYAMEDLNFHYTYPKAARNPILHKMICEYTVTNHHPVLFGQVPNLESESFVQHKAIVEAFHQHDPDLAERLLRDHIYYALRKNLNYIHQISSRERLDIFCGKKSAFSSEAAAKGPFGPDEPPLGGESK